MAKQTKITIETDTLLVVKGNSSIRAWCDRCGADAEMVALDAAGVISNFRPSEIEEWINSVDLHRSHGADGMQLICLNSLLWAVATKKK
jgi:hypothetical protein